MTKFEENMTGLPATTAPEYNSGQPRDGGRFPPPHPHNNTHNQQTGGNAGSAGAAAASSSCSPSTMTNGGVVNIDNPTPHRLPEGENAAPLEVIGTTASDKLVIILVGLPATGKTHIAKRICRFLSFFHDIPSQIFNVGDYRRQLCGTQMPAEFYDPSNVDGVIARSMACDAALADLIDYMKQDGVRVAAFDATNNTAARRKHILNVLNQAGLGAKRMFVESICDQEELLEENIRKVKLSTPDYRDMNPEEAVADFKRRRENYKRSYEPVGESDGPHIKVINSKQFIVSNIRGYLPLKVVHFVMNLHTLPRTFYLTRHGQSEYNLLGKIGGDSGLTPAGVEYAKRLAKFAKENISMVTTTVRTEREDPVTGEVTEETREETVHRPARLWTSTLRRTKETVQFIERYTIHHTWDNGESGDWLQFRRMARRNLDELYAGTCDGMTYKEIEKVFPEEFKRRQESKLSYRYPRGESYMDVTLRLEPLAQEMERTREPVLIVGHQGILRILYAYFMGLDRKEAPYVSIPLNNVIELSPHAYGCHEKRTCLMRKEEMPSDGQDEPTSMPVKNEPEEHRHYHPHHPHLVVTDGGAGSSHHDDHAHYAPNDPVMNAPSC